MQSEVVQVIVFNDGDRSVGIIVDQILDVVEEAVTIRQKSDRPGLLGSAVVDKQVTDFLDLNYVIQSAAGNWIQGAGGVANGRRILLAESSAFSRGLIRSGLDMAGYRVFEAANVDEAIRRLENEQVDVVVTALDLSADGRSPLLTAIRQRPEWSGIPVLALVDSGAQTRGAAMRAAGFEDCQSKFDRMAMIESLERLASALAPTVATLAAQQTISAYEGGEW
jgi:two-component system chemotaxis sensor kinase CheA